MQNGNIAFVTIQIISEDDMYFIFSLKKRPTFLIEKQITDYRFTQKVK